MRVTDYLIRDHDRIHLLLAEAMSSDPIDLEPYEQFRAALLRHIAIEEILVFPVGLPQWRARALRADHAVFASMLARRPSLDRCGELAQLLGRHDALEEGPAGAYAACERAIGAAASEALALRARDYGEVRLAPYRDLARTA